MNRAASVTTEAGPGRTGHGAAGMVRAVRTSTARIALAALAGVAAELAGIGLMAAAAWLIVTAAGGPPLVALSVAIVLVRAFALSRGTFRYLERLASHDVALRALAALRTAVWSGLVARSDEGGYRQTTTTPAALVGAGGFAPVDTDPGSADLTQRLAADVDAVQDLVVRVLVPRVVAVVVSVVAVGAAALLLPGAGLALAVGLLVVGLGLPAAAGRVTRSGTAGLSRARAVLAARSTDLVQGAPDLAVLGAETRALEAARAADAAVARIEAREHVSRAVVAAVGVLVQGLTTVVVTLVAASASGGDGASGLAPAWVGVLALGALAAFEPVLPLAGTVTTAQRVRAAADRVLAVLTPHAGTGTGPVGDTAAAPGTGPDAPATERGGVVVRGLVVRYDRERPPALVEVDLDVRPGARVAVVGVSGSGKTTLLLALLGLVRPESGSVLVSGRVATPPDDDTSGREGSRPAVGAVLTDDHLFHTTLRENLLLGRADASDERLTQVLDEVGLGPWCSSLPGGLGAVLGESGTTVSGGQRRRLALCRALLRDPEVLLLDEPTEGLDPDSARAVTADLLAAGGHRTLVLVIHELSGLDEVDEVVVLDAGRVVQRGSARSLREQPGVFHDLWWASRRVP